MAELNTLAPKKWTSNYGGIAPTIDITDGVLIGDVAIDTSNNEVWRCYGNTNGSPKWVKSFVETDIQSIYPTGFQSTSSTSFVQMAGSSLTATGTRTKKYRLQLDCFIHADNISTYVYMGFFVNGVSQYSGAPLYMGVQQTSTNSFLAQRMSFNLTHTMTLVPGDVASLYWRVTTSGGASGRTAFFNYGRYTIIGLG